jgi:hypothetical protein
MYKSWMWKQRSYREQALGDDSGAAAGGAATNDQAQDDQQAAGETPDAEQDAGQGDQQADDDGEVVITIGDEAPPAADDEIEGKPAPQWVRELRKEAKEAKKRVRELEQAEAARQATAAPKADPVGDAPTLESCDYDAEKYADAKLAWSERKRAADAKAAAERQQQEAAQAEWAKMQDDYRAAGSALKLVGGFDDAEATVKAALDPMQHAILVQGPKTVKAAAQLVGALSRNPAKLAELAAIKNPVKYAFALADVVSQLKEVPKKSPPPAESVVRGSAGGATSVDNARARLEAEADRTGDRSKLIAYDRNKRRERQSAA